MTLRNARAVIILRALIFIIAAAFIFIGLSRGEAAIVLRKAVRICLECIGVAG